MITGSLDTTLRIWNISNRKLLKILNHGNIVKSISLSDKGKLIVSAGGTSISMWDLESFNLIDNPIDTGLDINSVAISPDG